MEYQTLYNIASYVSALSILLPLTATIILYKALNKELRALFIYLIFCALTEIIGFILTKKNISGYFVEHCFTIIECTTITYIYGLMYSSNISKRIILVFYSIFILLSIFVFFYLKGYNTESNIMSTYESIFIISLSAIYFIKLLNDLNINSQKKYDFFWLNTAFLFYFCMAFFLFLFDGFIIKLNIQTFYLLYSLHLISNIAYNILLFIGIWKIKRI